MSALTAGGESLRMNGHTYDQPAAAGPSSRGDDEAASRRAVPPAAAMTAEPWMFDADDNLMKPTLALRDELRLTQDQWRDWWTVCDQEKAARSRGRGGVVIIGSAGDPAQTQWVQVVDALIDLRRLPESDREPLLRSEWVKYAGCPACGSSGGFVRRDQAGAFDAGRVRISCGRRCRTRDVLAELGLDTSPRAADPISPETVPTVRTVSTVPGATASGSPETVQTVPTVPTDVNRGAGRTVDAVECVREWFARFVCTVKPEHLDLLALWAAHTHLAVECYTTPRLQLDSPVHGSGKTTVLEHLERLAVDPVQMASLSSPALMTRMLHERLRTILIDEADRSLDPKKDGVADLIAVLNSGYKRGGTRPVLVPVKGGGWAPQEMPTFAPVAMAGNDPSLPDDTRSRSIRVVLMPDVAGQAEESDWEMLDGDARALGADLAAWADSVRDQVRAHRPALPAGVRGRARERWAPLKRIADAVGGRWPDVVDRMAIEDVARIESEREEGIMRERPAITLLRHLVEVWPENKPFMTAAELIEALIWAHPEEWGAESPFGRPLTAQRMGRMLVKSYDIHSQKDAADRRGYVRTYVRKTASHIGLDHRAGQEPPLAPLWGPSKPSEPSEPSEMTSTETATRPSRAVLGQGARTVSSSPTRCTSCGQLLDYDDGSHTHPTCASPGCS